MRYGYCLATLALLAWAGTSVAAPISGFGDPLTDPALIGGTQIDFESAAPGSYSATTIGAVTFTAGGQSNFFINADYAGQYNNPGQSLANNTFNYGSSNGFSSIQFDFAAPVGAFAFNFGASDETWILNAYDAGNNLLETLVIGPVGASNAGDYFGISFPNIAYATLSSQSGQNGDYIFVDNFTIGAVAIPEPATLAVFGLMGLVGAGYGLRRRRKV